MDPTIGLVHKCLSQKLHLINYNYQIVVCGH